MQTAAGSTVAVYENDCIPNVARESPCRRGNLFLWARARNLARRQWGEGGG